LKTPLNDNVQSFGEDLAVVNMAEYNCSHENPLQSLKKSIISVDCYPPFVIDGLRNSHSYGAGIIISMNPPLVLCDRDTVPVGISVISLTFENSITISADLLFLHPFYNFAILKFDPTAVIEAGIEIKVACLDDSDDFEIGNSVNYVGLSGIKFVLLHNVCVYTQILIYSIGRNEVDIKKTTITALAPIRTKETSPPRWRATNVEAFKVSDGSLASQGGLFADNDGKVRAIWMSFSIENDKREQSSVLGGLPAKLILPIVDKIKTKQQPIVRGLDVEVWTLQISNARLLGVSDAWIERVKKSTRANSQPHIIYILGITDISTLSGQLLKPADIILSINGEVLTNISDFGRYADCEQLDMVRSKPQLV
jgi:S1-C subfamily serine protease